MKAQKKSNKKISIIIPTLDEEKYIGRLLSSINNAKFNINVQIIIVDAKSKDTTLKEIQK